MANLIRHTSCDRCGSSDANGLYDDGSAYCYSCKWLTPKNGEGHMETKFEERQTSLIAGVAQAIPPRSLTQATCEFWDYEIGEYKGEPCHIANYRDDRGHVIAQKIRRPNKQFTILGQGKDLPLFGMWLWNDDRSLIVTEGEIDAMSVSQAFGNKYPVVSLPNGAQSAAKSFQKHYEYLTKYQKIVLCFDNDEPGQRAIEEVAPLLPPGKVFVMKLPTKDANDCLKVHGAEVLTKAFWQAKEWRPDGIRKAEELRDEVLNPIEVECVPYPYSGLNEKLGGLRIGEMITLTAGSGVGKSTLVRELAYDLAIRRKQPVGIMALEESNKRTMEGLMTVHLSQNLVINRAVVPKEKLAAAFDAVAVPNLFLFDHFGSTEIEHLLNRVRYMVRALGARWVIIDHLSIIVSGLQGNDERKLIDVAMTKLRTLVSELEIGMILVSHLRRPDGDKGHEDGAIVHLGQLRGSHSIAQLSDGVIAMQKSTDDPNLDQRELVVLKNRWSGDTGSAGVLNYDRASGRLLEGFF